MSAAALALQHLAGRGKMARPEHFKVKKIDGVWCIVLVYRGVEQWHTPCPDWDTALIRVIDYIDAVADFERGLQ